MLTSLALACVLAQTEPPPPPAAEPIMPAEFFTRVLAWDPLSSQAVRGREKLALSQEAFFIEVGRPDLIEQSARLKTRRLVLGISAGALLVAGGAASALAFSRTPDLNARGCTQDITIYNGCASGYRAAQTTGAAILGGTLIFSALLATLAWWSDPKVVDGDEATHLIARYNAELLKRLRGSPGSLRWLPAVTPDGAQLALSGRF